MAKSKKFNFWKIMALFFVFFGAAFLLWSITPSARQAYLNKINNSKVVFLKTSNHATLGTILVDRQGNTLYTFKSDKNGQSVCNSDCIKNWPPFLMVSKGVADKGITGVLGTFERADKTLQVTYNGKPLYFYAKDLKSGDAKGQNYNKLWTVAKP